MRVQVRLLGRFEVVVDGRPVPARSWRRQAASRLVKLLALQPSYRLHREQVIDALWPDVPLDTGATRLHTAAHYARAALGDPEGIVVSQGVVALYPDEQVEVDVAGFERAVAAAREAGDPQSAAAAAALYPGPLLPEDLYEPWSEEARDLLRLRYREMLRAAGLFEALVADDPLDEDAQIDLARDLLRQGRRRDARQALDRMAEVLERELGVEPPEAAQRLREELEAALPASSYDASDAAPPPTLPSGSALPAPRNRLIGRERDLDQVAALLRVHRVVTITGPGGAGKSTLAVAHARAVQAAADDLKGGSEVDVVLAELAPVHAASDVTRAVAEVVGVQGAGALEMSALAATLGPRAVLLVLDNCEHLLDESARLVDAILDAGDRARILVTSREPLRVDGEAVHTLGSLGSGAAELFVERASAAAGAEVVAVDDPRVELLCRRLDGLPLAIELAAAQLRHLSLDELVSRLDDRLTLLAGGRPRAGARHSALSATIDWSYRLLSDEAREVFDRLGAFPASFDLDAVVAVTGDGDRASVTNIVGDLVAKSLVVHERSTGRYRLLETIRMFAVQRLAEAGLEDEVAELLRRHVVARARSKPRPRVWLSMSMAAQSRDDLDNVRLAFEASLASEADLPGAVDIALAISTLWRNASRSSLRPVSYAEGRQWVDDLLARDLAPADRVWALLMSADVALGSGDPVTMRANTAEAVRLVSQVEDDGAALVVAIYDAMTHLLEPAQATRRLEAAAQRAEESGEPGLARLARGYRLVTARIGGPSPELTADARAVVESVQERDYDSYIIHWAASLLALVDLDAPRLRELMASQIRDLAETGIRENWLTMYWEALALAISGEEYVDQLRRSRARAESEGRNADADCVLALACAAASRGEWEEAAELIGAVADTMLHDTAGYIHLILVRDQMVRPQLDPQVFKAARTRGAERDAATILAEHGV
ncbi:ATP-binding protein [Nocardioides sp.]|uniref:ATP-binding protein n=1 Tax=Nocardioides sp. TaxID=35761 RepID=UPI002ED060D8